METLGQVISDCAAALAGNDRQRAREAVQRLVDAVQVAQVGGYELAGTSVPWIVCGELIGFVNTELRMTYLGGKLERLTLPAPRAWLQKLRELAADFGGKKPRRPAIAVTEEDKTILETLASEYPMAVTQPDLEAATNIPRQKIGQRLKWLESKRLVRRPEGTERKGHAITSAGLSAIGWPVEGTH